jgi:hypothetical protein
MRAVEVYELELDQEAMDEYKRKNYGSCDPIFKRVLKGCGKLHQWNNDGTAIVEFKDGRAANVPADLIRFTDAPREQSMDMLDLPVGFIREIFLNMTHDDVMPTQQIQKNLIDSLNGWMEKYNLPSGIRRILGNLIQECIKEQQIVKRTWLEKIE